MPVWGLFSCQALGRPAFHPYAQHTPTRTCSYLIIPCVKPGGENPGGVTQSPWRSEYMYRFASWSESQWARAPAHQAAGLVWGWVFRRIWCLHHYFNFFSQICSLTEFLVCNGLYMFIPPLSPLNTIIVYPHIIWIHAGGLTITEVVRQILLQTFEELLSLLRRRRVRCTQRASQIRQKVLATRAEESLLVADNLGCRPHDHGHLYTCKYKFQSNSFSSPHG